MRLIVSEAAYLVRVDQLDENGGVTPASEAGLLAAARALHAAQDAGDVAALDRLLHDRLVAIGPDGSRHTKD